MNAIRRTIAKWVMRADVSRDETKAPVINIDDSKAGATGARAEPYRDGVSLLWHSSGWGPVLAIT